MLKITWFSCRYQGNKIIKVTKTISKNEVLNQVWISKVYSNIYHPFFIVLTCIINALTICSCPSEVVTISVTWKTRRNQGKVQELEWIQIVFTHQSLLMLIWTGFIIGAFLHWKRCWLIWISFTATSCTILNGGS